MQAVDQQVLDQVCDWLETDASCWLATVVETWGSSPRPVGSLLTCNRAGQVRGSLSGGCVEDDLLEKLTSGELARERAQFFQYGITPEETERLGLPCGGHLNIVVEPLPASDAFRGHFGHLRERVSGRRSVRRTVNLRKRRHRPSKTSRRTRHCTTTTRRRFSPTPTARSSSSSSSVPAWSRRTWRIWRRRSITRSPYAIHARTCSTSFPSPGVTKVNDMPDDAIEKHANDPLTAIVALTHDPRIDDMGMMVALKTDAFYIGAMGSTRTSANRRERLKALELTDAGDRAAARTDRAAHRQQDTPGDRRRDPCRDHRRTPPAPRPRPIPNSPP